MASPAVDAQLRLPEPILTPQDIRAASVARGYRWCVSCGQWYHRSAEGNHQQCGHRRRRRRGNENKEGGAGGTVCPYLEREC